MLSQVFFFFLAVVAIAAGIGLVASRNPVSSALWLVLNLFCIAALYISMKAEFIGVIQVLVYAGAIMVLFLFVIMLLNLGALPGRGSIDVKRVVAVVLGLAVLSLLVFVVAVGLDLVAPAVPPEQAMLTGSAEYIGLELFTRYVLPLEVIAILLLVATIGALMLAQRHFE